MGDRPRDREPLRPKVEGAARMRLAEMRRMNSLDAWQRSAAEQIVDAAQIVTSGVAIRPQVYERVDLGHVDDHEPERVIRLQQDYFGWARQLQQLGIDHAAIFRMLVHGKTLEEVDQERRRRHGWARTQLQAGLDLWCRRAGWKRHPGPAVGQAVMLFARRLCLARTVYEATLSRPAARMLHHDGSVSV